MNIDGKVQSLRRYPVTSMREEVLQVDWAFTNPQGDSRRRNRIDVPLLGDDNLRWK
jgi:hypothetical protein